MSSYSVTATIEFPDGEEHDVEITYTYYPGCRGARDGRFGPPLEPDEPASVEIESAIRTDTKEDVMQLLDHEKLEELCSDDMQNRIEGAEEDAAEARAEAREMRDYDRW